MKPLIAIVACHARAEQKAACINTWIKKWGHLADIKFFIGRPKKRSTKSIIYLDVPDDYDSLPLKVKAMHSWALAHGYTNVFKCDDDTFVHVPRLLASGWQRDCYIGTRRALFFAQGGAGYWLDQYAMTHLQGISDEDWMAQKCEDIRIGFLLQGKFPLTRDPRYVDSMDHSRCPQPNNDIITHHKCTPELLEEIQSRFK